MKNLRFSFNTHEGVKPDLLQFLRPLLSRSCVFEGDTNCLFLMHLLGGLMPRKLPVYGLEAEDQAEE